MSALRARRRIAVLVVLGTTLAACVAIEHLSSTSQEAIVANPGSASFSAQVGQTSPPQTITFSPASGSGDSTDTISSFTTSCGSDFGITPPPLPATVSRRCTGSGTGTASGLEPQKRRTTTGVDHPASFTSTAQQCTSFDVSVADFQVVFRPQSPGTQNCQLVVQGTFGTLSVGLTGTGQPPPLAIDVQPPNIDFGDVRLGQTSRIVPVVVRNAGTNTLVLSSVSVDNTTEFQIAGAAGSHNIAPGAVKSFDVTCRPSAEVVFQSQVRILSNATNLPTALVPVACRGTNSALVSDPGSPVDLDTRVGEPVQRTIRVTNTGTAASSITGIQIVGTTDVTIQSMPLLPLNVAAGSGFFDVSVVYPASAPLAKTSAGKLRITHDGEDQDVVLSPSALITVLGANPDAIDFGPVCIGSSKDMPVAVFANAPGSFDVTALGTPSNAMFTFTGALGTAAGGHANELTYTASVSPTALGVTTDTVTITTDIPGAPTRDFLMSVDALPSGVSATPPLVDWGTIDVGAVSTLKSVKVTNCSPAPLNVTGTRIEGTAAGDFTVVGPVPIERTLQPTESFEVLVIMSPQADLELGAREAILFVTYSDGEVSANLTGTAVADELAPPGDPTDLSTYYSCSAGGTGGWLVGLVVLGLAIRRRRCRM